MNQNELLEKLKGELASAYQKSDNDELLIESLKKSIVRYQEHLDMLMEQNKRFRQRIFELRRKTGYQVYEENLRLQTELAQLRGELLG